MELWCLGSGSRGNAVGIRHGDTTLLVDVGFGPRTLRHRAAAVSFPLGDVNAVILTHEHADHAVGTRRFALDGAVPVYGTRGTLQALRTELEGVETVEVAHDSRFSVGSLTIDTCRIPHDARDPIAIAVNDPVGARVGIAYDVGRVTSRLVRFLERASALVLEANHDTHMLMRGPYPPSVRARIAGPRGHLSNESAGDLFQRVHHRALEWVLLAHVSQHCNRRDLALRAVDGVGRSVGYRGALLAARQSRPLPSLPVGKPTQLTLALGA